MLFQQFGVQGVPGAVFAVLGAQTMALPSRALASSEQITEVARPVDRGRRGAVRHRRRRRSTRAPADESRSRGALPPWPRPATPRRPTLDRGAARRWTPRDPGGAIQRHTHRAAPADEPANAEAKLAWPSAELRAVGCRAPTRRQARQSSKPTRPDDVQAQPHRGGPGPGRRSAWRTPSAGSRTPSTPSWRGPTDTAGAGCWSCSR